jgi:acyl carrier protein phosphodiesterase
MNFLAHLLLAGDDEDLRLGAMFGDFVRGKAGLMEYRPRVRIGIRLHRRIDSYTDSLPEIASLRASLPAGFRRFGGIIIDLALDHELARSWELYRAQTLESFDIEVRQMLARHQREIPGGLNRFMAYADRRGLFAAYREESEILHSLRGIGRRLSRPNPLHRVDEIWDDFKPRARRGLEPVLAEVQSDVAAWLSSKSITTGS